MLQFDPQRFSPAIRARLNSRTTRARTRRRDFWITAALWAAVGAMAAGIALR